jgi:hypothetical protein
LGKIVIPFSKSDRSRIIEKPNLGHLDNALYAVCSLPYVLKLHVYAMSRVMPHDVGERAIGADFIIFLMA